MGRGNATVKIHWNRVYRVLDRETDQAAKKAADVTARRMRVNIVQAGRIRTGALLASIRVIEVPHLGPVGHTYKVGSELDYSAYQEHGVMPQRARPGRVFVFTPKGSSKVVFASSTKGFEGAHFARDARRMLTLRDFL